MNTMLKFTMAGAPRYLNFKPSSGALAAMRAGLKPRADDCWQTKERAMVRRALDYFKAMKKRIPAESDTVQTRISLDWNKKAQRSVPRWLVFDKGEKEASRWGQSRFVVTKENWKRIEIPHWDFVADCGEASNEDVS